MGETAAGGVYLNPDGKTYHDANGEEVKPEVVAEAKKIQQEQSEAKTAAYTPVPNQSTTSLAESLRNLIAPQKPAAPQAAPQAQFLTGGTSNAPKAQGK